MNDFVIFPPGPNTVCPGEPEGAGSTLLYSKEFYDLATQHLKPGGIIQAWVPPENLGVTSAAIRSLSDAYPYVKCFGSIQGQGLHLLASTEPIPTLTAAALISRMPAAARRDLLEWSATTNLAAYLGVVLGNEVSPEKLLPDNKEIRITDDPPYSEYYLLRKNGWF